MALDPEGDYIRAMSMRSSVRLSPRERMGSGVAAASLVGALMLLLWIGLRVAGQAPAIQAALATFDVVDPPPPAPVPAPKPHPAGARPEAAKVPVRSKPKPVAALPPKPAPKPVIVPSAAPVVVAPSLDLEPADASGADLTDLSGLGGIAGDGAGSGSGDGAGGGGAVRPRHVSGAIVKADYPPVARRAHAVGSVVVALAIDADGRVTACRVARSSGNADLDATTCRLAQQRFRYTPARDAAGKAVPGVAGWRQDWWFEGG